MVMIGRSNNKCKVFTSLQIGMCNSIKVLIVLLGIVTVQQRVQASAVNRLVEFSTDTAKDASNLLGVSFVSRVMVPYGPDELKGQTDDDTPYTGYAYGREAVDRIVYDYHNQYFYAVSAKSYMSIIDFSDPHKPFVTPMAIPIGHKYGEIEACFLHDIILLGVIVEETNQVGETVEKYKVNVYSSVTRDNPRTPSLLHEIDVISEPGTLLANDDCSILAVAHSNPGDGTSYGSVTLVKGLDQIHTDRFHLQVDNVPLDGDGDTTWDDQYILSKGMNMPLTLKALEYWDDHSHVADDLDFSDIRANYRPSVFMSPATLSWAGPSQEEILVNMQQNNGILRLDAIHNKVLDITGLGLKNHEEIPVDINSQDKDCNLSTYNHLFAMRGPDKIRVIQYNDKAYVLTCNEGETSEYQEWSEIVTAKGIFNGTTFGLKNMEVPEKIFDPENPLIGSSALFNANCRGEGCVGNVEIGLGSNAIDYESDPTRPIFQRMVLHGGRGWSIFEIPEDPADLFKLVYDSADTVERGGCEKFPFAHNSAQDWETAPADNLGNNSLYLSLEEGSEDRDTLEAWNDPTRKGCFDQGDGRPGACPLSEYVDDGTDSFGSSIESAGIGYACGRLVAAVATERSSVALLYDITEINSPSVVDIFHLSPISETKSAGLAFNDGTIGDIVTRSITFLSAAESPTGKPSLMFVGTQSGTVSYYEINCAEPDDILPHTSTTVSSAIRWQTTLFAVLVATGSVSLMLFI